MSGTIDVLDERVLVLAPTGKDAGLAADALRRHGICTHVCNDLVDVSDELRRGAGATLVAEEALAPRELPAFVESLTRQPAWSDIPILVMTRGRDSQEGLRLVQTFSPIGSVSLLERPLNVMTLVTTVQAALRTRRRQYQVRDLLDERARHDEEMRQMNTDLEQRVALRTAELRAANSELEAFCYSVSHDLRAPLRAIDGFVLMLMEHANGRLDEASRTYLERARNAAQRMQRLIDDLLSLSRLSRAEMRLQPVDISALAELVLAELKQAQPERANVRTSISPGLLVRGDAALLRIALTNLLGNAWKFTSKTPNALIEFDRIYRDGVPVFVVRDNGAGFDMAYANKLFTPFQRLHTMHEFPGSGIGLAIVQRVLRRHSGEVWAEGTPGKGATFYFTLPSTAAVAPRPGTEGALDAPASVAA